ncbi:REP-associated tyrosine transposase [Azospirillum rugosum]|uniref:Transposase n=1 Tax=Azospirillum rugosum TaxID=416170 RepID=A0ABS4SEZ9_9PROT|nr:transposase [Azospirillum rugosum]MBP2290975.1 putative transposase [Azospirillum rugosum]MDQ0524961.1 putative transposase [Azospirillum rugosum]
MHYRRDRTPGGTYFFTVVTANRRPVFRRPAMVALLRESLRAEMAQHPFTIDAMVVLPDHLHAVWTLPEGDADYSNRWRRIKGWVTRHCHADVLPRPSGAKAARGDQELWQRRFWEHRIRDERDLAVHIDYIHINPVKHGLVASPGDWPHSSFRRFVRNGTYGPDWLGSDSADKLVLE